MRERIAKVISDSTLWDLGKDGHNALSELTESIYSLFLSELPKEKERYNWHCVLPKHDSPITRDRGFNQCLANIRAKLEGK